MKVNFSPLLSFVFSNFQKKVPGMILMQQITRADFPSILLGGEELQLQVVSNFNFFF
jgi:hypothetical protein